MVEDGEESGKKYCRKELSFYAYDYTVLQKQLFTQTTGNKNIINFEKN